MDRYRALAAEAEHAQAESRRGENIRIQIGSATCEHAAGALEVWEEFEKHIEASGRTDIGLHKVGCTGRCSCEPIVGIIIPGKLPVKYQHVDRNAVHRIFTNHVLGGEVVADHTLAQIEERIRGYQILVCDGARCSGVVRGGVAKAFEDRIQAVGLSHDEIRVTASRCLGFCSVEKRGGATQVLVRPDNVLYRITSAEDISEIVLSHLAQGRIVDTLRNSDEPVGQRFFDLYGDVAYFNRQHRVALRNTGILDPESIQEYLAFRGFEALAQVLDRADPEWVIDEVKKSKLRGRGGGGYPTGLKWESARQNAEPVRYIICNADEGDPGAFMDRSMLESDPFSIIEGMIIGGHAIGAQHGFFYIRAEYPLAIKRIEHAIAECRRRGFLGKDILGAGFDFDLDIRLGAGAFVCGEETALIHSIEGERGQPRIRPPFPAQVGLWGKPTVINNVETFANVPPIFNYGSNWFRKIGTSKSGGTKVFALAGKVAHSGLVEVPMGTTIRQVVYNIGGGPMRGKQIKAVQTGGPAGGCIPEQYFDTPIDYETLGLLGSIMGSGGMIVLDDSDCMVDIAKYFMTFCQDESCGKCTPCREGTKRMLEILERISQGEGAPGDLDKLERLGTLMKRTSLCGLGRAAANPVLSTIKYFRAEYEAHINERLCPARRCKALVHYEIDKTKCVGCQACAKGCPVQCIRGVRKEPHTIDESRCIKCGRCFEVCRFGAVVRG
jgi:NADH:ubiquinone oxidoreductase subunit F (NADH-binding)/(2Fe-2S) ferredoxin/Pyruvate/2-oxoacid:ferredoxin oxidoreductase delta subunit